MEYFLAMAVIILLDIYSKYKIKKTIPLDKKVEVIPEKFYFWHVKNKGIAYNGFENHTDKITYATGGIILVLLGVLAYFIKRPDNKVEKISLTFLIGGAVGNFLDRVKNKSVTDFLYIKKKNSPIFNIADIFIFAGGIIAVVKNLIGKD